MIDQLKDDTRVQIAAVIGRYFRIDPCIPLNSDYFHWAIYVAALQYSSEEEKKAASRASKNKASADSKINRMM